ncbi:hypothetical protein ACFE04_024738 [Oxalis oulophora]
MFGAQSASPSPFGTPANSTTPSGGLFGTPSSTPSFATPSTTPAFGGGASNTGFGSSLFSTPFSAQQQQQQQQQQSPMFQQPSSAGGGAAFGFQTPAQTTAPFNNAQFTTQMAPVAPISFSFADRDIQAIVDAYKEDPGNPKYAFKHLLFSVTEPQYRIKPAGVSDIMWAEAMGKLEGMDSADRERLWPQLVQGFKDLSQRLKIQDEVIASDAERLRTTQSNVKMLQRHFQADTLPWIQRMKQKEQSLQRRLLRMMRIVEALESKGYRLPLTKGEADLIEKLAAVTKELKGSGADLSKRVRNLVSVSRVQANTLGSGGSLYLPGSTKIDENSLAYMQEVLQQQTEAIAKLGNVLKRDSRDMEIIMDKDTDMSDDAA